MALIASMRRSSIGLELRSASPHNATCLLLIIKGVPPPSQVSLPNCPPQPLPPQTPRTNPPASSSAKPDQARQANVDSQPADNADTAVVLICPPGYVA